MKRLKAFQGEIIPELKEVDKSLKKIQERFQEEFSNPGTNCMTHL